MRQFFRLAAVTAVAVAASVWGPIAHAALSVADFSRQGDGLLTVDSISGLAWLDVSETRGMSVADVIGSGTWLSQGFRFATASDLDQLVLQGASQLDFMAWMGAWQASAEVSAYLGGPTTVLAGVLAGDGPRLDGTMRADTLLLTRDTQIMSGAPVDRPSELSGTVVDALRVQAPVIGVSSAQGEVGTYPSNRSLGDFLRRVSEPVSPLTASAKRGIFLVTTVSAVPEASATALWGVGLAGLFSALALSRRRSAC